MTTTPEVLAWACHRDGMPAVEIAIIEPVLGALSTSEGWIGLLLGLGGRETLRAINRLVKILRNRGGIDEPRK